MNLAFWKKEQYDWYKKHLPDEYLPDDKEIVQGLVNWLIISLYRPDKERIMVIDEERIKEAGVDNEPVNWGDLKCYEVKKTDEGTYIVYVDEADPNAYGLQNYIAKWMSYWGWRVEVITEW